MRPVSRSKNLRSKKGAFLAFFFAALVPGCASYYLPATHLDTPEVRGVDPAREWGGRLELAAIQGGPNLTGVPTTYQPQPATTDAPMPPVEYRVASSMANYSFGYSFPLNEKMDIGFRMQPSAPLLFRFKYQFSGVSELKSEPDAWSFSGVVSPGILLAPGVTYMSGDFALPVGYRAWKKYLFSIWPYFSFASLSGVAIPAAAAVTGVASLPAASATTAASASASQYGAALGYQYNSGNLFWRGELSYLLGGSLGGSKIAGIYFGGLLGLSL